MYQSVVCSCMYPGAIINAEAYHHLIFELYQKLGWYEEAVKYSEFDLNLKPSLTESFLQTIESRYRIIDVFLHERYLLMMMMIISSFTLICGFLMFLC